MLNETLIEIFERDLNKLKIEISSYNNESALWSVDREIKNSGGNLCLHIMGNLNQFIGAVLGGSGYQRNRDAEFGDKNIMKKVLISDIEKTTAVITSTLQKLSDEDLTAVYPHEVFNKKMTTGYFLIHLTTHLNYHLGQINYHRRLLDN